MYSILSFPMFQFLLSVKNFAAAPFSERCCGRFQQLLDGQCFLFTVLLLQYCPTASCYCHTVARIPPYNCSNPAILLLESCHIIALIHAMFYPNPDIRRIIALILLCFTQILITGVLLVILSRITLLTTGHMLTTRPHHHTCCHNDHR